MAVLACGRLCTGLRRMLSASTLARSRAEAISTFWLAQLGCLRYILLQGLPYRQERTAFLLSCTSKFSNHCVFPLLSIPTTTGPFKP